MHHHVGFFNYMRETPVFVQFFFGLVALLVTGTFAFVIGRSLYIWIGCSPTAESGCMKNGSGRAKTGRKAVPSSKKSSGLWKRRMAKYGMKERSDDDAHPS